MTDQPIGVDDQAVINDHDLEPATSGSRQEREQRQTARDIHAANGEHTMKVRVRSPFQDYYEGFAFSLSAESATGPFDILPGHHNFISLLVPCELIIRTLDANELKVRISGGLIHSKADEAVVFLDV